MDSLALRASTWVRSVRRRYLAVKARLQRKAFFCNALDGNSKINVCVNSDLTVSCSCHDVDGLGHIGDLKGQSLSECFSGDVARRFREELAAGRLPVPDCARCCDLRVTDKDSARRHVHEYHLPQYLGIENTSACNLRCLCCPRTRIRQLRSKVSMSLDDVRRVAAELKQASVKRISYLNFGEPFLPKSIGDELRIVREINPGIWIDTSTNALFLDTQDKRDAALLIDRMQVSLDGVTQPMVAKYQRGMDFLKAYRNMKALVEHRDARGLDRPIIIWKYLLFRWNDRKSYLRKAIEMAGDANVDKILFEKTHSPFHAISLRAYLGLHDDLGEDLMGSRCVPLRSPAEPSTASAQNAAGVSPIFPDTTPNDEKPMTNDERMTNAQCRNPGAA